MIREGPHPEGAAQHSDAAKTRSVDVGIPTADLRPRLKRVVRDTSQLAMRVGSESSLIPQRWVAKLPALD